MNLNNWTILKTNNEKIANKIENKLSAFEKIGKGNQLSEENDNFENSFIDDSFDNLSILESGEKPLLNNNERAKNLLTQQIEDLFNQFNQNLQNMKKIQKRDSSLVLKGIIERNETRLHDLMLEFRKLKQRISEFQERSDLLDSVRNDIKQYKKSNKNLTTTDLLLRERNSLDQTDQTLSNVLNLANSTDQKVNEQGNRFQGIGGKVQNVSGLMPGISNLLTAIKTRKNLNAVILGVIIGICLCILFWFWWRK
ncbi:golgi snap receptor complex member 1 [Anaeramoeba ignava]|uniref:Golgi snap receptor complex member 1 n=1 Tax=Anaeramoeba ignava TaxID=1746090 RepID=A0A9Q0R6F6_ANAIG|nr:golgi snap receptor complex member 1 [Anaeramoeba ignava]